MRSALVFGILSVVPAAEVFAYKGQHGDSSSRAEHACRSLQNLFPQLVSFPGSEQYAADIQHNLDSSEQNATCSVQPASAEDVSAVIRTIGQYRAPFAVKSGGHDFKATGSSTAGVQISLAQFKNISYDAAKKTVSLGPALRWQEVFEYLEPLGVMVAGGRVNSIGVGGYSLGGGFSWKTNQYGLLIDTVVSFDLVLPSGQIVHVTNDTHPDLFFGLKGGFDNFGIVTNITVEAHDQTQIFAGAIGYSPDVIDSVTQAISNFSFNNTDRKAQIYVSMSANFNSTSVVLVLFYDGPEANGIFDEMLSIPSIFADVRTRTFADFIGPLSATFGTDGVGACQHVIPVLQYPKSLLDEMVAQVSSTASRLFAETNDSAISVSITAEPFLGHFNSSRGGAYPHSPERPITPATPIIQYSLPANLSSDARQSRISFFEQELRKLSDAIQAKAMDEGLSAWDDILYPNYALADSPLELVYGENVPRLRKIAAKYDPYKVMTLTGGFKFQ